VRKIGAVRGLAIATGITLLFLGTLSFRDVKSRDTEILPTQQNSPSSPKLNRSSSIQSFAGIEPLKNSIIDSRVTFPTQNIERHEQLIIEEDSERIIFLDRTISIEAGGAATLLKEEGMVAGRFLLLKPETHRRTIPLPHQTTVSKKSLNKHWDIVEVEINSISEWDSLQKEMRTYADQTGTYIEPDYLVRGSRVLPNDHLFTSQQQWALHNTESELGTADADIDAPEAWEIQNTASSIIIGILDTGIRSTHVDIAQSMWINQSEIQNDDKDNDENGIIDDIHGLNTITNTGNTLDDNNHGTHIAGIVAATGNNHEGIVGVTWHAQLMSLKCLSASGFGATSDIVSAIDYAIANGVQILSATWESSTYSQAMYDAFRRAHDAEVLVVVAAGNSQKNNDIQPSYPANFELENKISVGSSNREDLVSSFSNYGQTQVDIFAPGSAILSTIKYDDEAHQHMSGTSMATAHVVGAAALLMERFPDDDVQTTIARLLDGADRKVAFEKKCRVGGKRHLIVLNYVSLVGYKCIT